MCRFICSKMYIFICRYMCRFICSKMYIFLVLLRPGIERSGIDRTRVERTGVEFYSIERTGVEQTGVEQTGAEYGQGLNARGRMPGVKCQGPNFTIFGPHKK
jgi:hypothetical protein